LNRDSENCVLKKELSFVIAGSLFNVFWKTSYVGLKEFSLTFQCHKEDGYTTEWRR